MIKLRIPIGVLRPFQRLAVRLKAVIQILQQPTLRPIADLVTVTLQLLHKHTKALARPAQRRLRIASRARLDQGLQRA